MFDLQGKIALVTGSSRGIGKAIALQLAKAGATVVINSNEHYDSMKAVVEEIKQLGGEARAIQADVSNEDEVKRLFAEITDSYGRLDILVNNAGTSRNETIDEITLEGWKSLLDINLTSCFLCSQLAMELMKRHQFGRIIQISSVVAHQGALYGHVHYSASKSAQLGFTKTLARTAAPHGITVNAVAPGIILTELLEQTLGEDKISTLSASIPMGMGEPIDVANAVVFLASEEAKYVTGITLDVNGGQYMR
ncbi:SDR family NAD(P)-dependent oxidoreductase [Paenibacillus roseipurpureus]|uniref:3-oxoacyl-ACP reductase family protein n=1 Tax=Paenibacillus roseopurpureus TaxID=2918901 RepID=A0AA96LJE0_9BACL|nr:3-oxoacyl-ACP reductase family protein [Paenibacillus sp. MBLB1832]WNR42962.1 3-oxoacyl-ACP reductase family protein [Paenibacillus sp. MBLB1832]